MKKFLFWFLYVVIFILMVVLVLYIFIDELINDPLGFFIIYILK